MVYNDFKDMTEAVVATGFTQTYSLTGLYDPDITGVGTQPITFDQWSAFFQRFRVTAVRYEVTFQSLLSAAPAWIGVTARATNALPAKIISWTEQPFTQFKLLGPYVGASGTKILRARMEPWTALGITKSQYMSDMDYTCSPSGNPTRQLYLINWIFGSTIIASARVHTRIFYEVELSEAAPLDRS